MKVIEMNKRVGNEFIPITMSDSFKKELNRGITAIIKPYIENYINPSKMYMYIDDFPVEKGNGIMMCDKFTVSNPISYVSEGILYWRHKTKDIPVGLMDEVEKGSLDFWIESIKDYDFFTILVDGVKKYSKLFQKFYLEGYRFTVEVQLLNIHSVMKIFFNEPLDEVLRDKVVDLLDEEVGRFNNLGGGLIHSLRLSEFKKNKYLKFAIDYGSSGDAGIDLIFDTLNNSSFDIRKVEVKGGG